MAFRSSVRGSYGPQAPRAMKGPLAPVWTTSGTLPGASTSPYSYQLVATDDSGDAPTYSLASGSLNPGLTLSSSGLISGTCTGTSNTATFSVRATDANGRYTDSGTLTIVASLASWNTASGSLGTVNQATAAVPTYTVSASPAGGTYSVTAGSLPPNMSLNSSTGAIVGRPNGNVNTTYNFTITHSLAGARAFSLATLTNAQAVAALDVNTASTSYAAVYYMGTDSGVAAQEVSRMQGYRNNIYTALANRGVPVTTYNQAWPFTNVYPYPSGNMIMTGGGGTDDGDSNVAYYSSNGLQVYSKSNTNGTFTGGWVGFYNCYYTMGGGSVGSCYMEYFYNITAYPPPNA